MDWKLSFRADQEARKVADRHYNRQTVGAAQFVPPGRCLVLKTEGSAAVWVTSWPFAKYVYCVGGDAHERGRHGDCRRCEGRSFHRLW